MDSDLILSDKRFAKLATDKKFRSVGKKHKKVKIDNRFQSLFTNEKFSSKCSVDKRGRPKNLSAKESFEKFYRLEESDSDSEDSEKSEAEEDEKKPDDDEEEEEEDDDSEEADISDTGIEQNIKSKLHSSEIDYARGEGTLYSDSSSEEDDEDGGDVGGGDEVETEEHFDKWGELDGDAERTEEETARLAVCNMDWDRVGAEDLFLLLSSFCPSTGTVSAVNLYLSDFGRERLEEEKMMGPRELRRMKGEEEEGEDDGGSDSDSELMVKDKKTQDKEQSDAMERVRQYQVNRLKYYYAIVDFDSVETAAKVYEECDGLEYELSATRLDLRFVPVDLTFSTPHSSCLHHPEPEKYQPKVFFTTALQQGKVELTWDEEDHDKLKSMKEAFSQVDNDEYGDVSNIIGSASESENEAEGLDDDLEEEEDEKDAISRYKALLTGFAEKDSQKPTEEGNMEFTWNEEVPEETEAENLTPWEKFLQKKKEKRTSKKKQNKAERNEDSDEDIPDDVDLNDPFFAEELGEDYVKKGKKEKKRKKTKTAEGQIHEEDGKGELGLMVMDSDDEKEHFDFKHIVEAESKEGKKKKKKWRKKKKELDIPTQDSFSVNVGDSRFSAMYSRPEFNIDPTNPNFKKTKNMEKIIGEKQKRIERSNAKGDSGSGFSSKKQKLDPDVSRAIKSVKNKWSKNAKTRKLAFKVKDS